MFDPICLGCPEGHRRPQHGPRPLHLLRLHLETVHLEDDPEKVSQVLQIFRISRQNLLQAVGARPSDGQLGDGADELARRRPVGDAPAAVDRKQHSPGQHQHQHQGHVVVKQSRGAQNCFNGAPSYVNMAAPIPDKS